MGVFINEFYEKFPDGTETLLTDLPFDIPDSWTWCRLGEISAINGGFAFKSANYTTSGIRVIRISDFDENGFINTKIVRHSYSPNIDFFKLESHNILMAMTGGTVGKSLFVGEIDEPMFVNQRVATIKSSQFMCANYLNFVISSFHIQKKIQCSKNSTNDNISMDDINRFLIPVPPDTEQKRIVSILDRLLNLIKNFS